MSDKPEKIRIKIHAETDMVGSRVERIVEWDRKDWEEMSGQEKEEAMQDELWNLIEWGYEVEGEDDE